MGREHESNEENKTRFEQLIEKAQDQHSKGAYEEALENLSQAIELAPDEPRVVKNPEIFVNALVERASVYKNLSLSTEAFADLEAAEDIIGGTNERLDHAREEIQKEREEIQKETLLKEKMRRAAEHAPTTERLHNRILRSILRPLFKFEAVGNAVLVAIIVLGVIGKWIIIIGLLIGLPVVLWRYNLVAISVWMVVGSLSSLVQGALAFNAFQEGRSEYRDPGQAAPPSLMGFLIAGALGALIGGGALTNYLKTLTFGYDRR